MKILKLSSAIKVGLIIGVSVSTLTMLGCSNGDSSVKLVPPTVDVPAAPAATLSARIVDTQGIPIVGATVKVVQGTGSITGTELKKTTAGGLITFSLNAANSASLKASAPGYFENTMAITADSSAQVVTDIVLTEKANIAGDNSIRFSTSRGTGADGVIANVTNENSATNKAKVEVPAGIKDENGTPIEGTLTLDVAHYSSEKANSLSSFPGGFTAQIENPNEVDTGATPIEGNGNGSTPSTITFKSAGFTAIELKDANGNKIEKFDSSTPIKVTMTLDAGAQFPQADGTPRTIVAGDKIPIWSFDSDTGKWRFESEGTVASNGNGGLQVKYEVTHLSYYNLDWFTTRNCTATLNFRTVSGAPYTRALRGRIIGDSEGWSHRVYYPGDGTLILQNAPATFDVVTQLYDRITGAQVLDTDNSPFNLCSGDQTRTITLPDPEPVITTSTTFSAEAFCSDSSSTPAEPYTGGQIYIFDNSWNYVSRLTTDSTGKATMDLPESTGYKIYLWDRINNKYQFKGNEAISGTTDTVDFRIGKTCGTTTTGATGGTGGS